jgi:hypothetical protein
VTGESESKEEAMTVERALRLIAGVFVGASAALAALHSPYWLFFTGFVALNLAQSAFTDWCPMVWFLGKAGLRRCRAEAPRVSA